MQNLLFNNFVCEAYGSGNASINGSTAEQTDYEAFFGTAAPTTTIYLEYTPITYVNLPVNLNPFTQFLVRWVPPPPSVWELLLSFMQPHAKQLASCLNGLPAGACWGVEHAGLSAHDTRDAGLQCICKRTAEHQLQCICD